MGFKMTSDNADLLARIGAMRQIASVRRLAVEEGRGRGMRVLEFNNGSGLDFTVLPDRGMDLGQAHFKGIPIAWITGNYPTAPAFYEPEGLNWLRSWGGGLLTGCGFLNVGGPGEAGGEAHGLHGRLSHIPAENVNTSAQWNGDGSRYELTASGELSHSKVFGEKLILTRRISTAYGENAITICDTIENRGFNPAPFMLLYHMNFGWPLVDEGATLELPEHPVTPQNQTAAAGISAWAKAEAPQHGFAEQVFYHELPADADGMAEALLKNPKLGIACRLRYETKELPYLVQWKQMGQGEYVFGLEPGNCFPEGQTAMAAKGLLRTIAPGEVRRTRVVVAFEEL